MTQDDCNSSRLLLHDKLKLDEISTQFESNWDADSRPSIENVLVQHPKNLHRSIVRELVAVECEMRNEVGENPELLEYEGRFPNFQDEVNEGFLIWKQIQLNIGETKTGLQQDDHFGDYRIVRRVGQGAMGIVYEAIQESLDRHVAIKTLTDQALNIPRKAVRFRREARTIAKLHHGNIVDIYESGVHNGLPYFAMRFIDGSSLSEIVRDAQSGNSESDNPLVGPERFRNVARIGIEVASALQYAHGLGVLHRDVKPSNLLFDENAKTWVSDFGLAKLTMEPETTKSVDVVGTLRYLPPEAVNGIWCGQGDVYSLGLTLYELVSLEAMFPGQDRLKLLKRKTSGDASPSLRHNGFEVPVGLDNIIQKAAAHDPQQRYPDAQELADDLRRFLAGQPITAKPAGSFARAWKWAQRKPAPAALVVTLLSLAIFGIPLLTYLWLKSETALANEIAERKIAVDARKQEQESFLLALEATKAAESASYSSSLELAKRHIEDGNIREADRLLRRWIPGKAPNSGCIQGQWDQRLDSLLSGDRRGWEWYYLNQQLDTSFLTLQGDMEYVWSVSISPDDKVIATVHGPDIINIKGCGNCEVILWDASSGKRLQKLRDSQCNVFHAAFSPDGNQIATLGIDFDASNEWRGSLVVWDVESGEELLRKRLEGSFPHHLLHLGGTKAFLSKLFYSADGKYLVAAPHPVAVFDASNLDLLWQADGLEAVQLSDDVIAVTTEAKVLKRMDLKTGEVLNEHQAKSALHDLAVSDDGEVLSGNQEGSVVCFTADDLVKIEEKQEDVYWGRISPDRKDFFYAAANGVVMRKSVETGRIIEQIVGHKSTVFTATLNSDSSRLVTAGLDGTAKVWDISGTSQRFARTHSTNNPNSMIAELAFAADGDGLVFASRKEVYSPINRPNGGSFAGNEKAFERLATTFYANWPRTDFCFSAKRKWLAAPIAEAQPPSPIIGYASSEVVGIWDVSDWGQIQQLPISLPEITSVAFNRDGSLLAVAGTRNKTPAIKIFAVNEARGSGVPGPFAELPVAELALEGGSDGYADVVSAMAFSDSLLAVAANGEIQAWGIDDFKSRSGQSASESPPTAQAPDFRLSGSGNIRFLDFSPDGKLLAAAVKNEQIVRLFNVTKRELLYEETGPRNICCVRFSPNGKRLALVGYDSNVVLCDALSGARVLSLRGLPAGSSGELAINARVVFSPDGTRIATNNVHGDLQVWCLPSDTAGYVEFVEKK